ncbi:MAG: aspartate/glutamate racemase family protein [Ignavibacteriales bacterium]|nr:aspartate/glutamate racemase family protein [Ignavibacteriales bacterium]
MAADVEARARRAGIFRHVHVIFCNALAAKNYGYNSMATPEEKIRIFSSALTGFVRWYRPDIILVACNTLSVLYAETDFAKQAHIPVIGIVDLGIEMMAAAMANDTAAAAIILGTPTTITANKHKEGLIRKGIAEQMIVSQACRTLESEIQENPGSDAVKKMIDTYLTDALSRIPASATKIYAGLCCTHYGYSFDVFQKTFQNHSRIPVEIIDPNPRMADVVFPERRYGKYAGATAEVRIVSRVGVTPEEAASLGALLERVSQPTARALHRCEVKSDLFEFTPLKK